MKAVGAAGLTGLAGCSGGGGGGGDGGSGDGGGSGSGGGSGGGSGPISIGFLADRTGGLASVGIPMHNVAQYWRDQTNSSGGLLDREVELIAPDPQSSNQQYKNQARKLILEDQVDLLVGGITSASRESMRPVIDKNKQLYFYPTQYEGGVCDEYTFVTAPTATQQLRPLVDYMMENVGTEAYFMAADYNFGQISADWAQIYVEEAGGTVLDQEFIPLSVSDFGSTIDRMSNADPDWILTLTVGANHTAFYPQAQSAGLDIPMASTTAVGGVYEHLSQDPPSMQDVYGGWNYIDGLPNDRNQEFISGLMEAYPDTPYVNQMAMGSWIALKFYEKAVEEAGTTDQQTVHEVLEGGLALEDTPQGDTAIDPKSHHITTNVTITRVNEEHEVEYISEQQGLEPTWLQGECDLTDGSTWDDPVTEFLKPDVGN